MKKRTSILSIVLALALVLTACGTNDNGNNANNQNNADNGANSNGDPTKVALILPQSLGDAGPADDMNAGLRNTVDELGIEGSVFEALQPAEYEQALLTYARQGTDLIIVAFPGFVEPLRKVAPQFPDTKFALVYGFEDFDMPNVSVIDFATWEVNYVVGVAAGVMTETGKLGHIVGSEDNTIIANYNAFVNGAQSVRSDATVSRVNANTFDDPAKGKEIALGLISGGADVLLGDAAKTTLGIIEASEENDVFVIGDASDHSDLAPANVLMDTKIGFGTTVSNQIRALVDGTWESGLQAADFSNEGIGLFRNEQITEHLSAEQVAKIEEMNAKVDEAIEAIASGSLVIERDIERR